MNTRTAHTVCLACLLGTTQAALATMNEASAPFEPDETWAAQHALAALEAAQPAAGLSAALTASASLAAVPASECNAAPQ